MTCSLCVNAMPEGEWCRACGEGASVESATDPKTPLADAIEKARRIDPVAFIETYNSGRAGKRGTE